MELTELFWEASIDELKQGYISQHNGYTCLLCGEKIEQGIIYQHEGVFYDAKRFMQMHIEQKHGSVFDYLIGLDKKLTGLTDHQNKLLKLFYQGKSDVDIQQELEIGSASTIRNHRFVLKEKERQAKTFLTMMELLKERDEHAPAFVPPPKTAKMVDDRYNITEVERDKVIAKCFPEGTNGQLYKFPIKQKQKLIVLQEIIKRIDSERIYHEKELNEVLKDIFADYANIRRYLIEYGFLDRKPDGSAYWVKN